LQHLAKNDSRQKGKRVIRALILSPTRELAAQIGESVADYGRHLSVRPLVVFGGVNENPQIRELSRGVDVLVACPGRLLDLHGRGLVDLSEVEIFVLDEADRMLDMGFVPDVRRIMKALPAKRQNLLFSATMPESVIALARSILNDPLRIDISPETPTVEAIEQTVMFVQRSDKPQLLCELLQARPVESTIVFTRTKHGANRLTKKLDRAGFKAMAIHGNKSQNARRRALNGFQEGEVDVLVATDVAARGIDVESVTHVFNFDLPDDPESYVHRIGRTGRAGRKGVAIAFCDERQAEQLQAIEKVLGAPLAIEVDQPFHREDLMAQAVRKPHRSSSSSSTPSSRPSRKPSNGQSKPRRRRSRSGWRPGQS
jgi:ATP-dependent RNA helicase RhlE